MRVLLEFCTFTDALHACLPHTILVALLLSGNNSRLWSSSAVAILDQESILK